MIEVEPALEELRPRISVIGVGGAGGNAVASMIRGGVMGVDFIAANSDAQALASSPAPRILQLGRRTTQGLGAGSNAELGRAAAEESLPEIERVLNGADMCFIAAGLGGGTGTGASPVVARAARQKGILTIGVVTRPFAFEGGRRARIADAGLEALQREVDTLIIIPNQNLFRVARPETTFKQAFDLADEVLQQGVRGITDLMVMPGLINLDFADLRTIMAGMGKAMMGTGEASGEGRAVRAAQAAIANPLLDDAVDGARGLVISISGGDDLGLMELDEAAGLIKSLVDPEADIIWGAAFDPTLQGRLRVSVVATGIDPLPDPILLALAEPAAAATPIAPTALAPSAPPARVPERPQEPKMAEPRAAVPVTPVLVRASPAAAQEELLLHRKELLRPRPIPIPVRAEAPSYNQPSRGPSLFERMTGAARVAVSRPKAEASVRASAAE